jgi:glutamate--cysteine ligase
MNEDDITAGLKKDGHSITLEPGGQFELSGAPMKDLHAVKDELETHIKQVNAVGKELGLGFAGMGYDPKWSKEQRPAVDKDGRFEAAIEYLEDIGDNDLEVLYQTCTAQVNLDFDTEQDMINKFRVGLSLQPVATALFANSPFTNGKPNGFLSYRSDTWLQFDDRRTGELPWVFDDDFGFEKYADYAINTPMMMVYRNNKWNSVTGQSFKDFMEGKLKGFEGEKPTMEDWMNHLGNLYPEVRLKKYLEMRGADCGPRAFIMALAAFWVGLLYDEESVKGALEITNDWTNDDREMLRREAPRKALKVPFKGGLLQDVAQKAVKLSKEGLIRRGYNEESFLAPIEEVASSGVTLAELMLKLYHEKWNKKIEPIFEELKV